MIDPDHPGISSEVKTKELERFLRSATRAVRLSGEVNVRITSDQEMRRLNREFRGKDKATDVLSFPVSAAGKGKLSGDIAISVEIARENAEALGHTVESEIKILVLHGLLHLAGHDHEADKGEMAALEQKLRARLKLPLGLIARTSSPDVVASDVEPAAPGRVFRGVRKRGARTVASANGTSQALSPHEKRQHSAPSNPTKHSGGGGRFHVKPRQANTKHVSRKRLTANRAGSHS